LTITEPRLDSTGYLALSFSTSDVIGIRRLQFADQGLNRSIYSGNVTQAVQSFSTDGIQSKLRMSTLGRGSVENIF
jgi:hypothetical protein